MRDQQLRETIWLINVIAGDAGDPGDDTRWGAERDGEDGDGELQDAAV